MVEEHNHLADPVFFQQLDYVQHDRAVRERDHRFRDIAGQGLDSGAEASGHDNCFQYSVSLWIFFDFEGGFPGRAACREGFAGAGPGAVTIFAEWSTHFFEVFLSAFFSSTFFTSFFSSCRSADLTT